MFSRENRRPKTAKFKIYLIFEGCRGFRCGSLFGAVVVSTGAGVQAASCYFANVSKNGLMPLLLSVSLPCFPAIPAKYALFRVLMAFLAGFVVFVWVCIACVLCVACVAFVCVSG